MEMRQVEITEEKLLDGKEVRYAGDRITMPKVKADEWIRLGWAKDPVTGETGERVAGSRPIQVHDSIQVVGG